MNTEHDYVDTIKHLMRLTREGRILWSIDRGETERFAGMRFLPTYFGVYKELDFELEDHRRHSSEYVNLSDARLADALSSDHPGQYRLVIYDKGDNSSIASPPLEAAGDLVAFIESSQSPSSSEKLADINRRLEAAT